jgi:lipoprotein-anchoring transpeptidase ErfK/SrfK
VRALRVLGLILVVLGAGLLGGEAGGAPHAVDPTRASGPAPVTVVPAAAPPAAAPAVALPTSAPSPATIARPASAAATSKPKPKPKPAAGLVAGTPCRATASACVDLSSNRAWLIEDGAVSYGPVPITHGRKGFRTPPGSFRVSFKSADHVSSIYDAEMPYSVFFNGNIAFHQGSLKQLSHGCIHLSGKAAKTFFKALSRGEVVQVAR